MYTKQAIYASPEDIAQHCDEMVTICRNRMASQFQKGIPEFVTRRFQEESKHLFTDDNIEPLYLYYRICEASWEEECAVELEGAANNLYIAYLLGCGLLCPLPTHYYCSACGWTEIAKGYTLAMDLPMKNCPHCHTAMRRDGISGVPSIAYPRKTDFTFYAVIVAPTVEPLIVSLLEETYGTARVYPAAYQRDSNQIRLRNHYFYLMPYGEEKPDNELVSLPDGRQAVLQDKIRFAGDANDICFSVSKRLEKTAAQTSLGCDQWASIPYTYFHDTVCDLLTCQQRELLAAKEPENYAQFLECLCISYNSYVGIGRNDVHAADKKLDFLRSFSLGEAVTSKERLAESTVSISDSDYAKIRYLYSRSWLINTMRSMFTQRQHHLINRRQKQDNVGIFWIVDDCLWIHTCNYQAAKHEGDILQYPLSHQEIWQQAYQAEYPVDYDFYPRGSIQFDNKRCVTQIYYDEVISGRAICLGHNYADFELTAFAPYQSKQWETEMSQIQFK